MEKVYVCIRIIHNILYREISWFISLDSAISGVGGDIRGYNMYSYCFNNPINMSDPTGDWPKWVETTAKVVSVVVAVANSKKGNSYADGYVGEATGGAIQAACSKTSAGVIAGGGAGVTVGTAITDSLNNWDPDSQNTTRKQMIKNATTSGIKALVTSSVTAYAGNAADLAKIDGAVIYVWE